MDFDNSILFGNATPTLESPPSRTLFSKSTKQRTTYVNSRWLYLVQHNWFERLRQAMSSTSVSAVFLEALDRDWTRSALAAEQKCQGFPPGPYVHELVQLRSRKTIISHLISSMKIGHPFETAIQRVSQHVSGRFPATLPECQQEYTEILKKIKELERDTVSSRIKEQQQNLEMRLMQADKAGAMAIRNIMKAEAIKEMQRQLKSLKGNIDAGITTVKVPTNRDYSTEYCKTCTSWKTLEDPVEVQAALQQRNRIHFGQAKGTFPTTPLFSNHVDWMASTIATDMILEGQEPFAESTDISDIVRSFQF
jgi:hypothetical protein